MLIDVKDKLRKSKFIKAMSVLPESDRRKVSVVVLIQILMGVLDLLGVAIIGVLGALTVTGVQSGNSGSRINAILNFAHLDNLTFQKQAAILGGLACAVLVSRTIFSVFFNRKILFFLSRRGAIISTNLISRVLSLPLIEMNKRSTQSYVFAVTNGVHAITLGVVGTFVILISDLALLLILSIGLFVVDPIIAMSTLLIFGTVGALVYKLIHARVRYLGEYESTLTIKTNSKVIEVLNSYRESVVRNRRDYYSREIGKLRWAMSDTLAELTFMPNISKYVIESTLVLSALIISAIAFSIQDAKHSIASLAIFMAAGTRIAPAILRIQQGALQIKSSLGTATPTLDLLDELQNTATLLKVNDRIELEHADFIANVEIRNVSLRYPTNSEDALSQISLQIAAGESVAIVGSSGAGKTSLVDVILGIIDPTSGTVLISGEEPTEAISKWGGAIGYVPQDVMIIDGTIKENVCLGFPVEVIPDEIVVDALQKAQLLSFVTSLEFGLHSNVGERGSRISGGQRQRLGIARALITNPKLLVLDEATSALDSETEASISEVILKLQGEVTVIMIAHRLASVRRANKVVYMENGAIVASGSFSEVRSLVPNFDKQAKLLEL